MERLQRFEQSANSLMQPAKGAPTGNPMKRLLSTMVLCASVLCPVPAFAYKLGSAVWGSPDITTKWGSSVLGTGATVTWSLVPTRVDCGAAFGGGACSTTALSDFMPSGYESQIQGALDAWAAVANLKFVKVSDDGAATGASTASGDIRFGARSFSGTVLDGAGGIGFSPPSYYTPPGGGAVINLTTDTQAGDVFFNSDFGATFSDPGYLFSLVAHETGHALGLDHTLVPNSLMNAGIASGLGPQADDIAGMQFLYGAPVQAVPEPSMLVMYGVGLAVLASRRRVAKA